MRRRALAGPSLGLDPGLEEAEVAEAAEAVAVDEEDEGDGTQRLDTKALTLTMHTNNIVSFVRRENAAALLRMDQLLLVGWQGALVTRHGPEGD